MKNDGLRSLTRTLLRQDGRLILTLGLAYFVDLYNFQIFSILRIETVQSIYPAATDPDAIGAAITRKDYSFMLLFGVIWGLYAMRSAKNMGQAIVWTTAVQIISGIGITLLLHPASSGIDPNLKEWLFFGARNVLFPCGLAGGIGLSITLISIVLARRFRTIAATLICVIGMCGPIMAAIVRIVAGKEHFYLTYLVGALFGLGLLGLFRYIGVQKICRTRLQEEMVRDSQSSSMQLREEMERDSQSRMQQWIKHLHAAFGDILPILLIGITINFYSATLISQARDFFPNVLDVPVPFLKTNLTVDMVKSPGRYFGLIPGLLVAGYWSWKCKNRKRIILLFLVFQLLALGLMYLASDTSSLWVFLGVVMLSGFSNGSWAIMIVHSAEALGMRFRTFVATIVPNIWRGAGGGLLAGYLSIKAGYLQDAALINIALVLGIFVVIISLFGAIMLKDNFEGDKDLREFDDVFSPDFPIPINDHQTHNEIVRKMATEKWEDTSDGLKLCGEMVGNRIQAVFGQILYMNALYVYRHEKKKKLVERVGELRSNPAAFLGLSSIDQKMAERFANNIEIATQKGVCGSFAAVMFDKEQLSGVCIFSQRPWPRLPHWRRLPPAASDSLYAFMPQFNLAGIHLSEQDADELIGMLEKIDTENSEALSQKLDQILSQAQPFPDSLALEHFFKALSDKELSDDEHRKLQKLLLLRRAESMRYPDNEFWMYVVRPASASLIGNAAVLIKTARAIPALKIREISTLMSTILLETANFKFDKVERDAQWRKINYDQNHTLRGEFGAMQQLIEDQRRPIVENEPERALNINTQLAGKAKWMGRLNQISLDLMKHEAGLEAGGADLQRRPVHIPGALHEALDTIALSLDSLRIGPERIAALQEPDRGIARLRRQIDCLPANLFVCVSPEMLYIVFINLLANSVAHADSKHPLIDILWYPEQEPGFAALHFMNNRPLSLPAYEFIQEDREADGFSTRHRGGLRTVKAVFNFQGFSEMAGFGAHPFWQLDCGAPQQPQADIFIKIPKQELTTNDD
ncbi:MAG: hypothetical protein IT260_18340 [Saprospiraceae bacterium]|nr:hypothetical protein [Saprospiraceae bacterium]